MAPIYAVRGGYRRARDLISHQTLRRVSGRDGAPLMLNDLAARQADRERPKAEASLCCTRRVLRGPVGTDELGTGSQRARR